VKLTNFELVAEGGVELSGEGRRWDLHNCVDFAGLELLPQEGAVRLSWAVSREPRFRAQGFAADNPARSCAIRFDGVMDVRLRRVAHGSQTADDARTVSEISRVAPPEKTPSNLSEAGRRVGAIAGDEFNLMFRFMEGFDIEVAAERATLEFDR